MKLVQQSNGTIIDVDLPRGLRMNNPGNIRISATKWNGEVIPSADKSFKQFESMPYGYRAMLKLIRNYRILYELDTIRKIISRLAPPNENNTDAYVNFVSKYTGYQPDTVINVYKREQMVIIAAAITLQENGHDYKVNMSDINKGWDLL